MTSKDHNTLVPGDVVYVEFFREARMVISVTKADENYIDVWWLIMWTDDASPQLLFKANYDTRRPHTYASLKLMCCAHETP